ncbi:hypothetical protein HBH56_242440 [Parastagonospora nodorum]|nr:hypothetical protein HBH56_242440 [Parastagonospora nodorum]QRC93096.1 hypothetical protein JI435_033380 [Parastagonospora nodorum SN15]KAH3921129.1 hypothetical protein HBH54_245020 [Parastagonospora nodorum]KAH4143583.1 hypothetical protein HBH45_039860 [Parastagonospora nodorum]KAH4146336.1 hypothetical protein HBH44_243450 [Parastagonospora nodorum]
MTACEPKDDPVIDMLWLLSFLLAHPSIKISFHCADKFKYEALHLNDLVKTARKFPAWRSHLDSMHSFDLFTRTTWCRGLTNVASKSYRPLQPWELKSVFKPEHFEAWWDNEGQRYQKTQQMLSDLGVMKANMDCFGYYCKSIARLLMHGFKRNDEDMNAYHESRAGWHRRW